ncbi:MAG: DegT/DnrJ/EryC1/StrS family aminotransferase [Desulfobacterales bacterium]|nr:DegT/DnrJ/EryC1/StrS family aminotransferase [Desulfobacterales bacterium]
MIPVNTPVLGPREKELLARCIDTGWISSEGPFVAEFEAATARAVDRRFGVAVSSGTAALDVAVSALGIGPGDEVILPAFTIISCAAAVVRAGAVPVVVDADPVTWNMDVARIEEKITPKTRAIMAVHIYGLPVDMRPLMALAEKHGLKVIEDAAEMLGQTYGGQPCGSFGDVSVLSFYPNKQVTTGEGGMVLTDDSALADRSRSFRNLCFEPGRRFVHHHLGWNYRMTNLQAAVGLAQLERLADTVRRKRAMGRRYAENLSAVPGIQLPLAGTDQAENIYWVFGVVMADDGRLDAEAVMARLGDHGIGTRPFFWPMHLQPVFRKMGFFTGESNLVNNSCVEFSIIFYTSKSIR